MYDDLAPALLVALALPQHSQRLAQLGDNFVDHNVVVAAVRAHLFYRSTTAPRGQRIDWSRAIDMHRYN